MVWIVCLAKDIATDISLYLPDDPSHPKKVKKEKYKSRNCVEEVAAKHKLKIWTLHNSSTLVRKLIPDHTL